MNARRTKDEIHGEVLHLLNDGGGPYTVSQVRAGCSLTYHLALEVLAYLIENEDVGEFWGKRDSGHYCAQYRILGDEDEAM